VEKLLYPSLSRCSVIHIQVSMCVCTKRAAWLKPYTRH